MSDLDQLGAAAIADLDQRGRGDGLSVRAIAHVCHEANRVLQTFAAVDAEHDGLAIAVPISPPWDQLDLETRESEFDGVRAVLAGADPERSHENWCRFKTDHGWTYGPVKDETRKTHPNLVPYDALPPLERRKDALFHAVVSALR